MQGVCYVRRPHKSAVSWYPRTVRRTGRLPGKRGSSEGTTSTRLKGFLRGQPCVNDPLIAVRTSLV